MNFLETLLLIILIFINLRVVLAVLFGKISAFSPIALFSLTVITQMFAQIPVLYLNDFYDNKIIPLLLFVMITCQLAFMVGFKNGSKLKVGRFVLSFRYNNLHYLILLFVFCGLIPMFFYSSLKSVYGGFNVILGLFRSIGTFGFIIALIYLDKFPYKNRKLIILSILIGGLPLLYFTYAVKGSREGIFSLTLIIIIFLSRGVFRKREKLVSRLFLMMFISASIIAGSITEIRRVNIYNEEGATKIVDINFIENFENSILNKDITNGMDLGSGAILIDYVSIHSNYDYGVGIWNGFIYNFFPSRLFGESLKNSFYIKIFEDKNLEIIKNKLSNGISTQTGYFSAFKSFSIFGFILFYFIGLIIGNFKSKSKYSTFYLFCYVSCLTVIPNMITHSTQYFFGRIELIFIFMFPIFYLFTSKKKHQLKIK